MLGSCHGVTKGSLQTDVEPDWSIVADTRASSIDYYTGLKVNEITREVAFIEQ